MRERLLCSNEGQPFKGNVAKSAAARRQDQFGKLRRAVEMQALPDGGMFAVHGHDLRAFRLCRGHDERAADHQRFLIGERQPLSRGDRIERDFQARKSRYGVENDVRLRIPASLGKSRLAPFYERSLRRLYALCGGLVAHTGKGGAHGGNLAGKGDIVGICRHRHDLESFGIAQRDVDHLSADGTRTSDQGYFFTHVPSFV